MDSWASAALQPRLSSGRTFGAQETAPLSGQSAGTPPAVNESKQTVFKIFSPKAAELSGVAGEFRCNSLHRSQISKDL
jgi:hypothetical protein